MADKILIIGMNYIGDTLFTTPLIKNLKNYYKDSVIDVVNGYKGIDILKNNPYINKIITRPKNKTEYNKYIEKLKSENYTIGYTATPSFYGAFDLFKAQVKVRIGVNSEGRGIFLTHSNSWQKHKRHIIDTIQSSLVKINVPIIYNATEIYLTDEEKKYGLDLLKDYNKPCIVHLGATRKSKRYPVEKFASLLTKIKNNFDVQIILVGGGSEDLLLAEKLKAAVSNNIIDLDLTNKLSIRELASVLSCAYSFIGGDSSPLHIASSFNIRTLGIYGDTYSKIYGARGTQSINTKGHENCNAIKSYYCEHCKRGCKSIECLNLLDENYLFDLFSSLIVSNYN